MLLNTFSFNSHFFHSKSFTSSSRIELMTPTPRILANAHYTQHVSRCVGSSCELSTWILFWPRNVSIPRALFFDSRMAMDSMVRILVPHVNISVFPTCTAISTRLIWDHDGLLTVYYNYQSKWLEWQRRVRWVWQWVTVKAMMICSWTHPAPGQMAAHEPIIKLITSWFILTDDRLQNETIQHYK